MVDLKKMMDSVPLPEMVQSLSQGLADAQSALTLKALDAFLFMANPENGVLLPGENSKRSLVELGLGPSFLHITEANISARVAFSTTESHQWSVGATAGLTVQVVTVAVNAGYSGKYSFEAQGSSEIRTRIVSVPAPSSLTERFRGQTKKP
jgi:hypothetical protein